MANCFEELSKVNVNDHTEKKVTDGGRTTLTYLSWCWAWAEVVKRYPDAEYEIVKFDGIPYKATNLGIMVYTNVTIEGKKREMFLPVMDGSNKAMKEESYKYMTKYGEKSVAAATMFDVNKAIMRCLTKNLAMFGLGLYIYAGEDLPEGEEETGARPEGSSTKTAEASAAQAPTEATTSSATRTTSSPRTKTTIIKSVAQDKPLEISKEAWKNLNNWALKNGLKSEERNQIWAELLGKVGAKSAADVKDVESWNKIIKVIEGFHK